MTVPRRVLLGAALALASVRATAIDKPQPRSVPGGVALLDLGAATQAPRATYNGLPLLVIGDAAQWTAVLGIALSAKPGISHISVQRAGAAAVSQPFVIEAFRYAEQRLTVPSGKVDLSKTDLERYERERAHLNQLAATFSDVAPATLRLRQPTPGPRSSSFGLRRIFNGQARAIRTAAWISQQP